MEPIQAYQILKEHLITQDNLIRQKVLGLLIGNSVLLAAFFMSTSSGDLHVFRRVIAVVALVLCLGFTASLVFDIRGKWRSIRGLGEIEKAPDFAYLKGIQGRPITDVEHGARGQLKYRCLIQAGDFFWPLLPVLFAVIWIWALTLKAS